jgi:hypothetical protein
MSIISFVKNDGNISIEIYIFQNLDLIVPSFQCNIASMKFDLQPQQLRLEITTDIYPLPFRLAQPRSADH